MATRTAPGATMHMSVYIFERIAADQLAINAEEDARIEGELARITRYIPQMIAEALETVGQASFENDHTEEVGDVSHDLEYNLGMHPDNACVRAWELFGAGFTEGYARYNSWHEDRAPIRYGY